jgi:hypothetical protein
LSQNGAAKLMRTKLNLIICVSTEIGKDLTEVKQLLRMQQSKWGDVGCATVVVVGWGMVVVVVVVVRVGMKVGWGEAGH